MQTTEHFLRSLTTQNKLGALHTSYLRTPEITAPPQLPPVIVNVNTGAKPSQSALQAIAVTNSVNKGIREAIQDNAPPMTLEYITEANCAADWDRENFPVDNDASMDE